MNQKGSGTNSQPQLRQTHVVSCFLLRTDMDQPRLLIVQRSQRVGSYNDRWAGISGFLETGVAPDEQAYTEIREETGLQGKQIRMLRHDPTPSSSASRPTSPQRRASKWSSGAFRCLRRSHSRRCDRMSSEPPPRSMAGMSSRQSATNGEEVT